MRGRISRIRTTWGPHRTRHFPTRCTVWHCFFFFEYCIMVSSFFTVHANKIHPWTVKGFNNEKNNCRLWFFFFQRKGLSCIKITIEGQKKKQCMQELILCIFFTKVNTLKIVILHRYCVYPACKSKRAKKILGLLMLYTVELRDLNAIGTGPACE